MLPKLMLVIKFRIHKSNIQKLSFHGFFFCGGLNSYVLLLRLENCFTRESSFPRFTVTIKQRNFMHLLLTSCATFLHYYVLYIFCQRKINHVLLKHLCFLTANMIKNPKSAFFPPVLSLHMSRVGHTNMGDAVWCGDNKRNWEQDKLKWNFRKHSLIYSAVFQSWRQKCFKILGCTWTKNYKIKCNKQLSLHREKGRKIWCILLIPSFSDGMFTCSKFCGEGREWHIISSQNVFNSMSFR